MLRLVIRGRALPGATFLDCCAKGPVRFVRTFPLYSTNLNQTSALIASQTLAGDCSLLAASCHLLSQPVIPILYY